MLRAHNAFESHAGSLHLVRSCGPWHCQLPVSDIRIAYKTRAPKRTFLERTRNSTGIEWSAFAKLMSSDNEVGLYVTLERCNYTNEAPPHPMKLVSAVYRKDCLNAA